MNQTELDYNKYKKWREKYKIYNDELKVKSSRYFTSLNEIELKWKELKSNGFRQQDKDHFWRLCNNGRICFWEWIEIEKKMDEDFIPPPGVPAFRRAVMLLEHEKKWKNAIHMCEEALKWDVNDEWYRKKIQQFKKKIPKVIALEID